MLKEAVMACFKVLYDHFPEENVENHEIIRKAYLKVKI
jgi:hypothetical protein